MRIDPPKGGDGSDPVTALYNNKKEKTVTEEVTVFLCHETPAIVAGFCVGCADEKECGRNGAKRCCEKAPSGRELSSECETEGERATDQRAVAI